MTWRKQCVYLRESDKLKRRALMDLTNVEQNVQNKKILQTVKKIKTQSFLRKIIACHFVQRKRINTYLSLQKIINLPDWRIKIKQR